MAVQSFLGVFLRSRVKSHQIVIIECSIFVGFATAYVHKLSNMCMYDLIVLGLEIGCHSVLPVEFVHLAVLNMSYPYPKINTMGCKTVSI